jgi:hypothetical protein
MFRPWKGVLTVGLVLAALPAGSAMAQAPAPPTITIVTPSEGATYTQGQPVTASYSCANAVDCVGTAPNGTPIPSGAPIDTSQVGSSYFTVTSHGTDGSVAVSQRVFSVGPTGGDVGGSTPATLNLTLGTSAGFSPFIPGLARDYATTMTATMTSTAADAALWVADPSATATGHLVNGSFALAAPLQVSATSPNGVSAPQGTVGGSAAPTPLLTYSGPLGSEAATLTFKQSIGGSEALRTGGYSKTLTFTLSTTTP